MAVFTIALMAWLALVWRRDRRNGEPAARWLLLILYLGGLSIGCHLLALLAGPAIVVLVWATLRDEPAESEEGRRAEWGMLALLAATWLLLVGIGLGSRLILYCSVTALLLAFLLAIRGRVVGFGAIGLALVAIGVTTYAFLYIRAGQHPPLNEAQPDNWDALLAVIRRAQYPPRTPFDDPTILHGPDNPGRTLLIFGYQLLSYLEYFDWQWANAISARFPLGGGAFYLRTVVTVAFFYLGLQGFRLQRRADRGAWWLCTALFLTTGLGLVLYMNFKLANMGYDRFPSAEQHEVRDRDYFFVVSFVVWGLWAGLGLSELARRVRERMPEGVAAQGLILAFGLLPFMLNFAAATRRQIPDARLPGDYAYDLLNSVPPYGIIFTYGDNDTFPLWWAQEVEGVRRDVTVVCLALAQTSWYMRQMRDRVPGEFDEGSAPVYWRNRHAVRPTAPLTTMTDADIGAAGRAVRLGDSLAVMIGPVRVTYPAGSVFYPNDVFVLRVLQDNLGRRPVAWSITAMDNLLGLERRHVVQRGLAVYAEPETVDTTAAGIDRQAGAVPLDAPATEALTWQVYRYASLLERSSPQLEPTSRAMAGSLAVPFTRLASWYDHQGDPTKAIANLERAGALSPHPAIAAALAELRLKAAAGRSGSPPTPRP